MSIEIFTTEAELFAATSGDGTVAYAEDTDLHFMRQKGRWAKAMTAYLGSAAGETLEERLASVGTTEVTILISRPISLAGPGPTTVPTPPNVRLQFLDGGRIAIGADQTLAIRGDIQAGLFQIFDYADQTSRVEFPTVSGGTGKTTLYPEWWGAEGDDSTDYTLALQRIFNVPSPLNQQLRAHFTSGRTYRLAPPGLVLAGASANSWVIDGYGSRLRDFGFGDGDVVVQLGNFSSVPSSKAYYLRWLGLSIQKGDGFDPSKRITGLLLSRADFCSFRDFLIAGFYYGVRAAGEGGNSLLYDHVDVSGAVEAVRLLGGGIDCTNVNGLRWSGGKIQQCDIGFQWSGAALELENVDFSLCAQSAIKLQSAAEARLKFYTEAIGNSGPGGSHPSPSLHNPIGNSAIVLHIIDGHKIDIANCRINGVGDVRANEPGSGSNNCAKYGIRLDGCDEVRIRGNRFTLHQDADIYYDARCGHWILIEEDNGREDDAILSKRLAVGDATAGRILDWTRTRDLPRQAFGSTLVGRAVNLMPSSCDFTDPSWSKLDGAVQNPQRPTTLGPDGVSQAQVWILPDTNGTCSGHLSRIELAGDIDLGEPLDGKVAVLRYWFKPMAPGNASVRNSHRLRSHLQRAPTDASRHEIDCVVDGSGDWHFVEHRYAGPPVPGNPSTMDLVSLHPNDVSDGIEIALWGVQLFVLGRDPSGQAAERQHMPYLPKPARIGSLNARAHGRVSEGPRILAYGHKIVREIVAEGSPEVRSLTAPPGDDTWRRGDLCWTSDPVVGGPAGWICIVDGVPGTWKAFGTIDPVGEASYVKVAPDAAPEMPTVETPFFRAERAIDVQRVFYLPNDQLTAHPTDTATFVVQRRDSGGAGAVTVASLTTNLAGGGMTAFVAKSLGSITNSRLTAGQTLAFRIDKHAGGVIVPAGTLAVACTMA